MDGVSFRERVPAHKLAHFQMAMVKEMRRIQPSVDWSGNYAAEGGLRAPLGTQPVADPHGLMKYHSARDFRFVSSDGFITGIRCKDGLLWWTAGDKADLISAADRCATMQFA